MNNLLLKITKILSKISSYNFRKKFCDTLFKVFIFSVAGISILLLVFVIFFIFKESLLIITKGFYNNNATLGNIFSLNWQPVGIEPKYGIIPLIMGSIKVATVALIIALPLGIFSALYVNVYAHPKVKELIKPIIEIIAGLPTVVIGFFMLMIGATFLQNIFQWDLRLNSLVGGIGVAIVIIPVVFTISEDAMNSLPKTLIESAYAMGASKHHIAWKIVLPSSINGVFSAGIVGGMRAFGETMIVLMATGNSPIPSWDLLLPARTMSATIASEMGEVQVGDEHYAMLFLIGFILLIITILFNLLANFVANKFRQRVYSRG